MQTAVVPLWSLLEACREGSEAEQDQAARTVQVVVCDLGSFEGSLAVELVEERLVIDGLPVVSGIDTFTATQAVMRFLYAAGMQRVEFAADVSVAALTEWGTHVARRTVPAVWPSGVETVQRSDSPSNEVVMPPSPQRLVTEESASRLRSVFLQHRLIAGLPSIHGVDPMTAKLVIEGVVDRLLQVAGGLEPLMLLQQDEALLRRSTAVAVLTVVFARRFGWPVELLADLGATGLLHDLGSIIDPASPGRASFQWLLERGDADFWLRSALVARRWRDGTAASMDQAGPLSVIAVVRMAAAAHERGAAGLDALLGSGAAPAELVQLAKDAIAAD